MVYNVPQRVCLELQEVKNGIFTVVTREVSLWNSRVPLEEFHETRVMTFDHLAKIGHCGVCTVKLECK